MANTFQIGEYPELHEVGNEDCPACWLGRTEVGGCPQRGCPGLLHEHCTVDEVTQERVWTHIGHVRCDVCGYTNDCYTG